MKRFSLQGRLLLLLLAGLAVVWAAMLGAGYHEITRQVGQLADLRLQQGARTLLALDLKRLARVADSDEDRSARIRHGETADHMQPLMFQVWSRTGVLQLASDDAPAAPFDSSEGYATRAADGRSWRSFSVYDEHHGYWLVVLEPLAVRERPVREVAEQVGEVAFFALPVLMLLVWVGVRTGLSPLDRMSRAIGTRDAGNLDRIQLDKVPNEAAPLVEALNALLARLSRSLDRERAFTADAAHELRTPLAAIRVQAEVALNAQDDASRRRALAQVIAAVDRASHLAQQLLTLARLEHGGALKQETVDLAALAAECMARRANDATARGIDIELEAGHECRLQGDPATLGILIDNLLDNAIKYGVEGSHVRVSVQRVDDAVELTVADDGPGIGETDPTRLHDRFFRGEGVSATGSGLGLSIVERIAAAHAGAVSAAPGLGGAGLAISIRFGAERATLVG